MAESGALPLRNDNDDPAVLTLFSGKDQAGVGELLDHPSSWAIDLDCGDPGKGLTRMPARLLLRLSTVSVLRHDAVGLMVEALCSRLPRLISIRDDIHLALQEAVGNAVIHGNLGLDGRLRATREGLLAFTQVMHRRSDDPRFGHRPVTIAADWNQHHLVIRVEDRGRGFKPSRIPVPIKPTAPSGRGLCHIRALCRRVSFTAHGRRISMRFALP
ncbi:MAG: ATP-binding protein [Magnetospirillum sp.]|nr:ATP-binding protein [Magnetospirillum sp.]